ncbi:MAG: GTP-binding protein [Candidatus Heimdallarchaeota archaeon]|nr:MAG: GTP-binding protein [Candidatus Heimdallarchaeota archaeon]
MDNNNPINRDKKEVRSKSLEDKVLDEARADEMEEFYLKVRVNLEDAMSGRKDYLSILDEAYSEAEKTEKDHLEDFRQFGLEARKTEDIYLISCFMYSGTPIFDYPLLTKIDYQESRNFMSNVIKNYTQYKLGELVEVLTLESQTIHFFVVEEIFIVSIVTSKHIPRDKVSTLAIQIGKAIKRHTERNIQKNTELRTEIDRAIASAKATLIQEHHTLKVILIGDGAVGKTSIRRQYLGEGFKVDYQMTIGADLAAKTSDIVYAGGKQIKYLIWDLAGQPRFHNVRKIYYMSAVGALVVFDMTRPESFQNIVKWMNELWRNNGRGPVPLIVLGNKTDLCSVGMPCVSESKAHAFVSRLSQISERYRGFKIYFLQSSAKTGENIEKAFELLGEAIIDFLASVQPPRGK